MPIKPKKPKTFSPRELFTKPKILIFGQPGAGKTHLIGSMAYAPDVFGKILLLCPDPGTLTLAFDDTMNSQIDVCPIEKTQELDDWFEWLTSVNRETNEYQTLAIDGVTDINKMALLEAMQKTSSSNSHVDPDKPNVDHYGRTYIITGRAIRRFRNLPMTVIVTALEKEQRDESSGVRWVGPEVSGKLVSEIPAMFDIVGRLYVEVKRNKETKEETLTRCLRVVNDGKTIAKDRSRRLGEVVIDPTLPNMVETMRSTEGATDTVRADPAIRLKKFSG